MPRSAAQQLLQVDSVALQEVMHHNELLLALQDSTVLLRDAMLLNELQQRAESRLVLQSSVVAPHSEALQVASKVLVSMTQAVVLQAHARLH
jgi:hypothetical protein